MTPDARLPARRHRVWPALLAGLLALAGAGALAQGLRPVPPLEARVTDLTGTLTAAEQSQLEQRLAEFEARKGAQIAVLIVPTTRPEEIEQFGIRVADAWKLGRAKPDDGALLLVAKDDRRLRIEVGRGLEGALTDLVSKRILDETVTPLFRQGDFAGGVSAGIDRMISVVDGEPLPAPDREWSGGSQPLADLLPLLIAVVLIGSTVLQAFLGRALGSAAVGGFSGFLGYSAIGAIGAAVGIGALAFFASLLFGFLSAGRWSSGSGHGGGSSGGWGGGGGFGSGGGGGFSGGGGSFGGGGASGSW